MDQQLPWKASFVLLVVSMFMSYIQATSSGMALVSGNFNIHEERWYRR